MKIKQITNYLEEFAPLLYQENYDNCGLIVGDENAKVKSVLVTLDCTEAVVDEAINAKCQLIIAHHPIIFTGLKKLTPSNYIQRTVIKAIKNSIAIYAIHTNLDNAYNGVNFKIAEKIGLNNLKTIAPKQSVLGYLSVFCPVEFSNKLKDELFKAGAGEIGNYSECSFTSLGRGSFTPKEKAKPFLGNVGQRYSDNEEKLELIFPKHKQNSIIEAMKNVHPYEEISYQIYVLDNINQHIGSGVIGELQKAVYVKDFFEMLKQNMKTDCIRYTKQIKNKIQKVAICGGTGSFLLEKAKVLGADVFISSDFKYHEFFDADSKLIIADIGHYESEQFTKELIYDLLTKKFTKFAVQLSKVNTNPINYL